MPTVGPTRSRRAGAPSRLRLRRGLGAVLAVALLAGAGAAAAASPATAPQDQSYARISGEGSSWAGNALLQWQSDVRDRGLTVDYNPNGASVGRRDFALGTSDFAVSEIPYTGDAADPRDTARPSFAYSLLPVLAGGESFMYNLPVDGNRLETLQLTQAALAGIFSGRITRWNDPTIALSNPAVNLPAHQITAVVRADGAGVTAQFTAWMLRQFPQAWQALCARTGCNPNAATSYFPYQGLANFVAQPGSGGVTTYTAVTPYTIDYDEFSSALGVGLPVVGLQNAAGFYVTPTDTAVAVALTRARTNADPSSPDYLSQDLSDVYTYGDPRTYPISTYTYLIVPAAPTANFTQSKGAALGAFAAYDICEGQQSVGALGYSPLPMNLVLAAMDQILKIPGVDQATRDLIAATRSGVVSGTRDTCGNPTFEPGDDPAHNRLLDTAPFPAGCDAACQAPWQTDTSHRLTVTRSGAGTGTVTSASDGIACGAACVTSVSTGTQVTLTASPATGSVFGGWSGCDASSGTQCTVTVSSDRAVTATFDPVPPVSHDVTLTVAVSGPGAVSSSPAGITACTAAGGANCQAVFTQGTSLTLIASHGPGSRLRRWSGACSGTGPCTPVLGSDQQVTATFHRSMHAPNTRISNARINRTRRAAIFAFTARGANGAARFQCRLSGQSRKLDHWRRCASGITYAHLAPRTHVFRVRAVAGGSIDATPAKVTFRLPGG